MTVLSIDNNLSLNNIHTDITYKSMAETVFSKKLGFMFMGDYNCYKAKYFKKFDERYMFDDGKILILQVPHHGSYKKFNNKLVDLSDMFIVSASTTNRYGHPNASVIKSLASEGKRCYWVKEKEDNMLVVESEF